MLASDTLLQGLKEGTERMAKSNYLSVKRSKKYRRQSDSGSEGTNLSQQQDDCNFTLSIVVEGIDHHSCADGLDENKSALSAAGMTNNDIEFVGLDVLALEKMSFCGCESSKQKGNTRPPCAQGMSEMVRSSTDYDFHSRRPGYDPHGIYDISEFPETTSSSEPLVAVRSATIAGYISHISEGHRSVPPPPEMMPFLEEPLLLVGPKLEWEGYVKARKISNEKRRKRRQQQMTPQELNKMTRMVIGYTLAFFLLVIVTFYIVYFV